MQVTRYQMHNVLECYGKKLSRTRGNENISSSPSRKSTDEMALSSDTSRMAAMDKISRQVLDKVMDVVALSSNGKSGRYSMPADDAAAEIAGEPASMEFTRHPSDAIERQCTARLTLGDS